MNENYAQKITEEANKCVKCGLCLTVCPSFSITKQENSSPRGRISLLQGATQGHLDVTETLTSHLDQCLQCRSCETICPSSVSYGSLIRWGREWLNKQGGRFKRSPRLLRLLARTNYHWYLGAWLLWIYQTLGLQVALRKCRFLGVGSIQQLDRMIPKQLSTPKPWKHYYPPTSPLVDKVVMATGCMNSLVDRNTLNDAINVLNAFGVGVTIPTQQFCCGALDHLANHSQKSEHLLTKHFAALKKTGHKKVITLATGCLAHIQLSTSPDNALQHVDLLDYLAKLPQPSQLQFVTTDKKVAIHVPCTQKNGLKNPKTTERLLQLIPGLTIITPKAPSCCGSAGDYLFKYPEAAKQLGQQTCDAFIADQPDIIVTANIGCSLQFKSFLNSFSRPPLVLHPISLLNSRLCLKNQPKIQIH